MENDPGKKHDFSFFPPEEKNISYNPYFSSACAVTW